MATYPVEFHRRLEQKWESRIEQILSLQYKVAGPEHGLTIATRLFVCPSTGHRVQG